MRVLKWIVLGLAGFAVLGVGCGYWAYTHQVQARESGLALGSVAPAFSLTSQSGDVVSLDELRQEGSVAVLFYRSADW